MEVNLSRVCGERMAVGRFENMVKGNSDLSSRHAAVKKRKMLSSTLSDLQNYDCLS